MNHKISFAILLLTLLGCRYESATTVPPENTADTRQRVRLALNWFPEAEHGGFYAAQLQGYFADEGLEVEILPGGPGSPVVQQVARGSVEFAVATADQIPLGRAQGANVVATMAAIDDSPRCFLVRKSSGIQRLDQLKDITLAMSSGRAFAEYLKANVPLEGVRIVPYDGGIAELLRNENFAQQGYEFSEPFLAQSQGLKVQVLPLRDLGYNPYASLLITSDQLNEEKPELVAAVTRACRRGWKHYLQSPEQTNKHLQQLNPELTPGMLQFATEAIRPLTIVDQDAFGQMKPERWETLISQLEALALIPVGSVSAEACYVNPQSRPVAAETANAQDL